MTTPDIEGHSRSLTFNFCRNLVEQCQNEGSYAAWWWKDDKEEEKGGCTRLTHPQGFSKDKGARTEQLMNADSNGLEYLEITYKTETPCAADGDKNYQVTFQMVCDKEAKEPVSSMASENECPPIVKLVSKENCKKVDINALWDWAKKNYWIVDIAMFVLGAF